MTSFIVALGLCTSVACSDDDDNTNSGVPTTGSGTGGSGTAGSGTAGTGTAGTGTAGSGTAGSGTAGSGTAGTGTAGTSGAGTTTGAGTDGTGTMGTGTGTTTGTGATGTGADPSTGVAVGGTGGTSGTGGSAGTTDAGADAGAAVAAAAAELEDGQMLFVVDTINAGEVDQARVALPELEDESTRAYAQLMIEEHQPARDRLLALAETEDIALESSEVATQLRQQSEQVITDLLAQSGDELERTYLQAQVAGHSQALGIVTAMIPAADADALENELTQLRASIAGHLEAAQQLLGAASDSGD